jgi:hypothetical protein
MDFCGNAVKLLMQAAHRRFGTLQHRRIFPRSQRGITSVLKRRIILLIEPFMEHGEDCALPVGTKRISISGGPRER